MPSRRPPESAAFGGPRRSWRTASAGPAAGRGASTATASVGSGPLGPFIASPGARTLSDLAGALDAWTHWRWVLWAVGAAVVGRARRPRDRHRLPYSGYESSPGRTPSLMPAGAPAAPA